MISLASFQRSAFLEERFQSSGDFIADRRFAYAQACLKEGDLAAAIDLFEQTVEAAPGFAPAWFELGKARAGLGLDTAAEAFERALAIEPEDALGAGIYLAQLGVRKGESAMQPAYIRRLFDHYAPRFEAHLTETLGYHGPTRLFEAVAAVREAQTQNMYFQTMLDLGCGTGLAGMQFANVCSIIEGCDLAPAMLAQAAEKRLYKRLEPLDALAFLQSNAAPADLILAADMFPYLGDLGPVFNAASTRLAGNGLFAFSLQSQQDDGFSLGADFRYAHSVSYLKDAARAARFAIVHTRLLSVRREQGRESPSLIAVLAHG